MYEIKTEKFAGPLGLLMDLIESRKLSINEISLAEIADQYIEYVKQFENFPTEEVSAFVTVASTLILIKSRSLLPNMKLTEEEEQSIGELEDRLKTYQRIRELGANLKNMFGKTPLFCRESFKGMEIGFLEPKGLSAQSLYSLLKEVLEKLPQKEILPQAVVKKIISLEEKIEELMGRVAVSIEISFAEFSSSKTASDSGRSFEEKKTEIIISFLAMLELVKRGVLMARQENLFENIGICKNC